MSKVCVATGSRAEYGLLKPVIERINNATELELYLLVTGAHLSSEFGLTYKEIEKDGYTINKKVEMLLSADTPSSIVKSMGVEMLSLADIFAAEHFDMIVILGDRYEMLIIASAALVYRIPIAHIHGGETTEGAIDEAIRHAITKMSYLHFASTEVYRNRIIQLGEEPQRVFNVGALGVENIKKNRLLSKKEIEDIIQFKITKNTIMVTYHPVTLENQSNEEHFENLLKVLRSKKELRVIFTKANSDPNGRIINYMIDEFVKENKERSIAFISLGQIRYLSVLKYCSFVVGNSSSGIVEAPSFHIPTVDIGDRQKGRVSAESVIHCGTSWEDIEYAIEKASEGVLKNKFTNTINPYEGKDTSLKIVNIIKIFLNEGANLKKSFYDLNNGKGVC